MSRVQTGLLLPVFVAWSQHLTLSEPQCLSLPGCVALGQYLTLSEPQCLLLPGCVAWGQHLTVSESQCLIWQSQSRSTMVSQSLKWSSMQWLVLVVCLAGSGMCMSHSRRPRRCSLEGSIVAYAIPEAGAEGSQLMVGLDYSGRPCWKRSSAKDTAQWWCTC